MKQKFPQKISLRVLYLEDSKQDVEIIQELLSESGYDLNMDCAESKEEFISLLKNKKYNVILSDFKLYGFDAFGALQLVKEICPDVPFICISGSIGEETAIELIKHGAVDYILKDRTARLPSAIKRAVDEVKEKELRQKAEQELIFQNIILSTQEESSIDGILVVDENGRIISYNQTFLKMWNIPSDVIEKRSDELTLKIVLDNIIEPKRFIEKVNYLYAHKSEKSWEEISLRNGRIYERYSAPMLGTDEKYYGRVWYFRDITERKLAEEALRKSEEKYRSFVQNLHGIAYRGGVNFKPEFFHGSVEEITGYTEQEFMDGKIKWDDIIYKDDLPMCLEKIEERIQHRPPRAEGEFRIVHKDGSIRWIHEEFQTLFDQSGNVTGSQGIQYDVTENKLAEKELQEKEKELSEAQILSHVGSWKVIFEKIGKEAWKGSAEMYRIYGYPLDQEITYQIAFEKTHPDDCENMKTNFKDFIEGKGSNEWEYRIVVDGKTRWIHSNARRILDNTGTLISIEGTVQDITEQKMVQQEMIQMQKMQSIGTLAGGIAHDFNNILGILLSQITSIQIIKNDAGKFKSTTHTLLKTIDRGKTLVQQILMFARKTETKFGPVNVNDIVMEVTVIILETFPKVIKCVQEYDKKIPYIEADHSKIHQVLLNLCVNARDAMPSGGTLKICTRMVSGESIREKFLVSPESKYICVEVSDTGTGMTEEVRKRIFEPFFTTKELGKGTGLGLAVVFGIIQEHKGFIDVESKTRKGTIFRIYLPAFEVMKPVLKEEKETLESISGGTETLLIIEDEQALLIPLEMILNSKGYKVLTANDGMEALNIYNENRKNIALVLTDLGLPKISGLEVCRQLKQIEPGIKVILATGYLEPEMKDDCVKSGIVEFLFKPYEITDALKVIREVLDGK